MGAHPYEENRRVELTGSGYPTLGYLAAQLGAVDSGMPQFVKVFYFHYSPDPKPFGRYTAMVEITREAYPGQFDHPELPSKPKD